MTTILKSLLFKSEMPMPFASIPGRKILFDVAQPESTFPHIEEPERGDPYAATRRAVVRAAAEIAKDMK